MSESGTEIEKPARKFEFKNIRVTMLRVVRYLIAAVFLIAGVAALTSFFGQISARKIENTDHDEFWQIAEKTNLNRANVFELEAIAQRALETSPPIIHLSEEANAHLRRRLNTCLTCENRTVFIELYNHNRLTTAASEALSKSFQLSPYGELELMQWRLEICNQFWNQLNEDQRKAALMQITAIAQEREADQWLRDFENPVRPIAERLDRLRLSNQTVIGN